jgi:hypothetical protein
MREGKLVDGVAGSLTPAQIEQYFRLAAAPLFSLSS